MPNRGALEKHFISLCKLLVTSTAPRTAGVIMLVSCLQNFTSDKFLTSITLDSILKLVVLLAVWNTILADVFTAQYSVADFALEAAEVPLSSQGHKRLAVLDVSPTATAVVGEFGLVGVCGRHGSQASLADTLFPTECDTISGRKGLFANGAHKAGRMIALPQHGDDLSLHVLPTVGAGGAVEALEVHGTQAVPVLYEEAGLGQVTAAHLAGEALDVEVGFLNTQHLSPAGLPTSVTLDGPLLHR